MRRSPGTVVASAIAVAAMLLGSGSALAQYRDRGGWGGHAAFHGGGPAYGGDRGDARDRDGYREGYRGGYGYGGPRDGHGRRVRCRDSGTGGTIIGAIAGGLLGNSISGYGDRTAGTIVGAGGGALVGRALDRDC